MANFFHIPGILATFYSQGVKSADPLTHKAVRRALKKVKLYDVEKETGIHRATVRRFRDGEGDLSFKKGLKLMDYLGIEHSTKKKR